MKHVIILATAALVLTGCQQSVDQQFASMCKDQEANDPKAWAVSKPLCQSQAEITESSKQELLDIYAEIKRLQKGVAQ